MNRREAIKASTLVVGGALVASSGLLEGCAREATPAASRFVLSPDDQNLMVEIADTLLPTTPSSPGARAAGIGPSINLLVTDCYDPAPQQRVVQGLKELRAACRTRYDRDFTALSPSQRETLLREIAAEAKKAGDSHYWNLLRDISNTAYFSSETGMTKALRYIQTPGYWTGCMPLQPAQPAWA